MADRLRNFCVVTVCLLAMLVVTPITAQQSALETLTPEETLFVTDFTCAAVCRDYSPLLKDLRVEWLILSEGDELAASTAADKDLLLVGALNSPAIGPLLRALLTEGDIAQIEKRGWAVLEKEHPWRTERTLLLAVGIDESGAKAAAESAVASILDAAPSRSRWFREARSAGREELQTMIAQMQQPPPGAELPIEALAMEPDESRPRSVSAEEAADDVRYLFRILEDGWCGYGTFQSQGDFGAAEQAISRQLAGRDRWRPGALAALLREELSFIRDCHLKVGDVQYCSHLDFWYDETLGFWPAEEGYHFDQDGANHRLLQVNERAPEAFLIPSLDETGGPIYRLGMLSYDEPAPLRLKATIGSSPIQLEIPLSTAGYQARERFAEERLGGIPVIRVPSFADYYAEELNDFVDSAKRYPGEPYLILDIRGNGGGNTRWPKEWIRRFTGVTPSLKQVLAELVSQTTMMGRANLFAEMQHDYPDSEAAWLRAEQKHYLSRARRISGDQESPYWSDPIFPDGRFIPNDTTLIVVVDRDVASAGEGLLSYLHDQVENVLVVGENSLGALTFGQISLHQLPNSKLRAYVPIKLNAQLDLAWREEKGFTPDLWLPPDDALNYAVAAARAGTISSRIPLPEGYFAEPFKPEDSGGPHLFQPSPELLPLLIILALFVLAAALFGRQGRFFVVGGLWLIMLGAFYILRFGQPAGYLTATLGTASLLFGLLWRRRAPKVE